MRNLLDRLFRDQDAVLSFLDNFAVHFDYGGDVDKLSRLMGYIHVTTTEGYVRSLAQQTARHGKSVLDSLT